MIEAPQNDETGADETTARGEADFGFRRVPEQDKAELVRDVFDRVAGRYDLMNDLMSLGVHRLWKTALIDALAPRPGERFLDLAGGTGDIAFRIHERIGAEAAGGRPILVCDINEAMLRVGRDRALDRGITGGIAWLAGDAEALPVEDMRADACTIAFGLRNVTRIDRALAEIRRSLRPGGRFLCLEFSRVALPLLGEAYDRYSFAVLPGLGRMVTGDADAYRYLAESIRRFPHQQALAERMRAVGFERVSWRNLSGGIAALHTGWRL
ncbi:MAG: class I SAM-dependent methyltransferase [Rhodospirillaceae bacterium]|nr:class I SAM-dependent methyltransferase [Rhodospirillaceae bacterium]MBT6118620.1 class I SAM-dependent methyltransferase [Rhodospirillaceae bacterium]